MAALEALADLACRAAEDLPRRDAALAEIGRLAAAWPEVAADMPATGWRDRAEAALGTLGARWPKLAAPHLALAAIALAAGAPRQAIARIEAGLAAGAPLVARYLELLLAPLHQRPRAEDVARILAVPPGLGQRAGWRWPVFRLHAAVALGAARAQVEAGLGDWVAPDAVAALRDLAPDSIDIPARLDEALAAAAAAGDDADRVRRLAILAGDTLLLCAAEPDAEAARERLLDALLDRLAMAPAAVRPLLVHRLLQILPATARAWTDPAFRRSAASLVQAGAEPLPEPARSWHRGLFAFLAGDDGMAAAGFAAVAAADPHRLGAGTYIDPGALPPDLLDRAEATPGEDATLRFEALVPPAVPASGPVGVVSADARYLLRHGLAVAESLAASAPKGGRRLHLHLIGDASQPGPVRDAIAAMAGCLGRAGHGFTLSAEPVTVDAPYWYATARFLRLPWMMRRLGEGSALILRDIDLRWAEDPEAWRARAWAGAESADVGLRFQRRREIGRVAGFAGHARLHPATVPWHLIDASTVVVAGTPGSLRFARLLAALAAPALRAAAARPPQAGWVIDQNLLLAAYRHAARHHPEIRFLDLGRQTALPEDRHKPGWRGPWPGEHPIGAGLPRAGGAGRIVPG